MVYVFIRVKLIEKGKNIIGIRSKQLLIYKYQLLK